MQDLILAVIIFLCITIFDRYVAMIESYDRNIFFFFHSLYICFPGHFTALALFAIFIFFNWSESLSSLCLLQGARVHLGTGDGQAQSGSQLLPGGGNGGTGRLCGHAGVFAPSLV